MESHGQHVSYGRHIALPNGARFGDAYHVYECSKYRRSAYPQQLCTSMTCTLPLYAYPIWHTCDMSVVWSPTSIRGLIDGIEFFSMNSQDTDHFNEFNEYAQSMNIILNVAVGGLL